MSWPAGSAKERESQKHSKREGQQLDHIRTDHLRIARRRSRAGFRFNAMGTENRNDRIQRRTMTGIAGNRSQERSQVR